MLVEPRAEKSRGVDQPGPTDRHFRGGTASEAPESNPNLQVDLGYVWKCLGMCDSKWCKIWLPGVTFLRFGR